MFKLFKALKCDHDYHIIRTTKVSSRIFGDYDRYTVYCHKCDSKTEKVQSEWEEYVKINKIKNSYKIHE